mmetsp:Transcript_10256/g.14815  ORF Transcript_10256/g.14815 Transcript_10256/m.14815 type:complete len:156 (-) Transcript_10256:9-476(-)
MNNEPIPSTVTTTTTNKSSSVRSTLSSSSTGGDDSDRASRSTRKSSSTKSTVPSLRNKELSQSSRRSTRQVSKFKQDRNDLLIQRSAAYAEALRRLNIPRNGNNKKKKINIAQVARDVWTGHITVYFSQGALQIRLKARKRFLLFLRFFFLLREI